jgi:hypothetical protein
MLGSEAIRHDEALVELRGALADATRLAAASSMLLPA